jgi:hypothetical protein
MRVINDPHLERLLSNLHDRSDAQAFETQRFMAADGPPPTADAIKAFRTDKLVALDRDKAEFCYQLCRASNARRIVEAGTSYGVSTLYLAAAVRTTSALPAAVAWSSGPNMNRRRSPLLGRTSSNPASTGSSTCARAICGKP